MQHELLVFLDEDLVHLLHVHLGTEGDGGKALGLAAGEDCASVCIGKISHFAPDGAHLRAVTAVQADAFVQDKVAHRFLLNIVVVPLHEGCLFLEFLFGNGCKEFFLDGLEAGFALMLGLCFLCEGVALVIACSLNCLAEFFILHVVRVVALGAVRSELVHEFFLDAAVLLDLFMSDLDGLEHVGLAHFLHFTFHHHDVLFGGGYHQFDVG